jgi:dimethylglycine dehydrogenase
MSAGLAGVIATDEMARTEPQGPNGGQRLVRLQIHGNDAEPWGGEPIFRDGRPVAQTRAGGYGHLSERSFALATLPSEFTQPGTVLEIDILGRRHRAVVVS